MKRILGSFLLGILPIAVLALLLHGHLQREAARLQKGGTMEKMPKSAPVRVAAPSRSQTDLLEDWQAARDTDLALVELLEELETADLLQLLSKLDDEDDPQRRTERHRQLLFDRLSDCDLSKALEYAESNIPQAERVKFLSYLAGRWAMEDPDACWAWFDQQSEQLTEREHDSLFRIIATIRSTLPSIEREVADAWRIVEEQTDRLSGSLYSGWRLWPLANRARETGEWAETIERITSTTGTKVGVLWPITQQWLDHDFEGATAWVATLPEGAERAGIINSMTWDPNNVRMEGEYDHGRLCDWLYNLGWTDLTHAFSQWAEMQPIAAGQWLAAHPGDSELLEKTRIAFAQDIAEHDAETAIEWASSLSEPSRERTIRNVCQDWYREEPWAAIDWAKENLGWSNTECARYLR